ncbi:unnamed protein product [Fusarium equiseti]|uniref:Uncharacterized protein n=1 Tax=Fusarium equiseti TaxID=61235 RepID=A0A8J2NQ67_FUSEQ|nr:unnamed protein product [Fusarium equiseti]
MATAATVTMTEGDQWTPNTFAEIRFKESLTKLAGSTDPVMLTPSPSLAQTKEGERQQKLFLLQSKAYFGMSTPSKIDPRVIDKLTLHFNKDLKAYVMSGRKFPQSNDEFDKKISKNAFKRLEVVDSNIYDDTKRTMVGIGSTCGPFYTDNLFQIVQAGSIAKTWASDTLENLQSSDAPAISLYTQLMVLCDTKYKTMADLDDDFAHAREAANIQLTQLEQTAKDKCAEATRIVTALLKFRSDTNQFVDSLQALITKYSKTPVKYNDKTVTGYLAYISADYADSVVKMGDELNKYNSAYDDWKTATGLAVGVGVSFGWFPLFGWVALAFAANNADNLHSAYEKLWDNYNQLKSDNEEEAHLIDFVTTIIAQFTEVGNTIQGAVDAVGTLSTMMQDQADAYSGINSTLHTLGDFTLSSDAVNRQIFIKAKLKISIKKLEELYTASNGFMDAIMTEDPNFVKTLSQA